MSYRYFSPTAGWVAVPDEQIKSYRADVKALLSLILHWLDMPPHIQPVSLLPDLLWELGETWVGRRRMALLFLRRAALPETLSQVRTALLGYPRRGSSLIFTDARPSKYGPDLPGEPILLPLLDLFPPNGDAQVRADMETLATFVGMPAQSKRTWSPVECSEDGGYLRIHDQVFHFTGYTHKRIIRILYEAWERGKPRQRTSSVLEEAESRSRAFSQAFSGCKEDWKAAIGYGDGYCWLMV